MYKAREYAREQYRINFEESENVTEERLLFICSRSVSIHGLYELLEGTGFYCCILDYNL